MIAIGRRRALQKIRLRTDRLLPDMARACMEKAEKLEEPLRTEEDATSALLELVADRSIRVKHRAALKIVRRLLDDPRALSAVLKTRTSKGENSRQWAIFLMMSALLGWTENDDSGGCVFPYKTRHRAAQSVADAFAVAGIRSRLTADAVLKVYQRHFNGR